MSVRPFAHEPKTDNHKAVFYSNKPKGINATKPTPNSKTQKRKANKAAHMKSTAQFK